MKTILEIFYIRIVSRNIHYQRKVADLSKRGGDPDAKIQSLIREKRRTESGEVEEQEFIVHSTSWRYERGRIMLTYAAYSDELEFKKGTFQSLSLKKLRTIHKKSRKPRSQSELQNKVVSHAMRHIAFLLQTGDHDHFRSALAPETAKVFETIWGNLAGKVFEKRKRHR